MKPFEIDLDAVEALPPAERRQELARLAAFKKAIEANPLWQYVPHEGDGGKTTWGQLGFHRIDTFIGAYVAGNRAGKTHSGAIDLLIQTLDEGWLPPWLRPFKRWHVPSGFAGRVVGVDLPNWLHTVMLPKLRSLIPPAALYKGDFDKAYNDRNHKLRFADGSYWDFLTHDMDVDAFAGAAVHQIWFDEEPPGEKGRQQFDESLARLIDYDGQVRMTLTPLLGLSWVYYELTDEHGQPRDDTECRVVTGDMEHNPHTSEKMKRRLIDRWQSTDPLKAQARKSGRWVHFAGLIYDEYRDGPPHVVPDRPIPRAHEDAKPSVPIYGAIDPGINEDHKAALVFAWLDERDVLEVFWAQKFANLDVDQVADIYFAVLEKYAFKPRWTVIDPAARNRNAQTGRSIQWSFQQRGVHTIPGQNSRQAGYNEVKSRLKTERLLIHQSLDQLRDEFLKYRWKPGRGRSEDAAPPEPIKINDDLLDALRYLAMSMPVKAAHKRDSEPEPMRARLAKEDLKRRLHRRPRRIGATR